MAFVNILGGWLYTSGKRHYVALNHHLHVYKDEPEGDLKKDRQKRVFGIELVRNEISEYEPSMVRWEPDNESDDMTTTEFSITTKKGQQKFKADDRATAEMWKREIEFKIMPLAQRSKTVGGGWENWFRASVLRTYFGRAGQHGNRKDSKRLCRLEWASSFAKEVGIVAGKIAMTPGRAACEEFKTVPGIGLALGVIGLGLKISAKLAKEQEVLKGALRTYENVLTALLRALNCTANARDESSYDHFLRLIGDAEVLGGHLELYIFSSPWERREYDSGLKDNGPTKMNEKLEKLQKDVTLFIGAAILEKVSNLQVSPPSEEIGTKGDVDNSLGTTSRPEESNTEESNAQESLSTGEIEVRSGDIDYNTSQQSRAETSENISHIYQQVGRCGSGDAPPTRYSGSVMFGLGDRHHRTESTDAGPPPRSRLPMTDSYRDSPLSSTSAPNVNSGARVIVELGEWTADDSLYVIRSGHPSDPPAKIHHFSSNNEAHPHREAPKSETCATPAPSNTTTDTNRSTEGRSCSCSCLWGCYSWLWDY